ncbi:MAG: rod shape-determining protein MreC [Candidatus Moranbacteria bacterium]|nr:rod shape-determining protein MreC [Candidatus Moranbacteria bacterium]
MQRLISTRFFKVFLVVSIFGLIVFINPVEMVSPVRNILLDISAPFKKGAYAVAVSFAGVGDFVQSIGELKEENAKLIKQNEHLIGEQAMLKDVQNENEELREQLNLLPRSRFNLLSASVIGQDPNGMGNWLEIDKGSQDGLFEGMPVIVSGGILVGRIQELTLKNSKVILLTNPKSVVSVTTTQTGARGVVKGEYGLGMIFDMILQTDSVQSGNEVVTSGTSGEMPRGLYVGTVQNVHPSDDQLFQQASVISPIKTSKLQFVFVLLGNK